MSLTLRRIRVSDEPPPRSAFPPVPMRGEAEPYRPTPEPRATTTATGRPTLRGWLGSALRRLRGRVVAWREEAIRDAWADGCRAGRTAERAETRAALRKRLTDGLEAGHYDLRDGNGAVRQILAYLDQETQ